MKTRLLKIPVMVLLSFFFLGCNQALEKERDVLKAELETLKKQGTFQKETSDCRRNSRRKPDTDLDSNNADLSLKFNCNESRYQPLHLDLKVGLAILGKAVLNEDKTKIKKMTLTLKEAGDCSRYVLKNAIYQGYNKNDKGKWAHDIKIEVIKGKNNPGSLALNLNDKIFNFKTGQLIDIHMSGDKDISPKADEDPFTRIGTQFCKSKITGP